MQTPCMTCPNCRSLNFKEMHKCTNKYREKTAFSRVQSKKEKNQQRKDYLLLQSRKWSDFKLKAVLPNLEWNRRYDSKTEHIHLNLRIAKFEKYSEDSEGRLKMTAAAVERYLNEHGINLPTTKKGKKKKLKVTASNMLQVWEEHKPSLHL